MSTTITVDLCHLCEARPVAAREDVDAAGPTPRRLIALAGDDDKAVAHFAAVAIAYRHDAEAWKRLAAAETEDTDRAGFYRKHAAVAAETSMATAQAAQDAKSVSTR